MTNPFDISNSPTTEPESMVLNTFVQWRRLLDYSDTAYSLYYVFQDGSHGHSLTVTGTYDSVNEWWEFSVGNGGYDNLHSGLVRWDLFVERLSDTEKVIITTGSTMLHVSTDDRRTHAEIMVSKIESVLEGRAAHDIESYTIKSRSLTRMSVKELTEWREYYLSEVERTGGSSTADRGPKTNTVRVRFIS